MNRLSRVLLSLAVLLMIGHLLIYVQYAVGLLRFPFDYDQGEGFELVDTVMLSKGEWPYQNNEVYPFYASNYPPLFHVILIPFVWLFGEAYWYGRLAGFVSTLITAYAIGYVVEREGKHRGIAVLAGLSFLASNYIYHVGPLFRQHLAMVMFETLSITVLAHVADIIDARRRRRVMISGLVLLLAAGFTKQLALATCVAVFAFLFLRQPRRSVMWGAGFAAVAGAIFLWINLATGGEWWTNIIAANVNLYMPQQFVGLFKQWFRLHAVLIILAGLFAVYELYFDRLSLYSVWWVAALANSALSGKWGAGDSYFASVIAATCLLSGIFAARTLRAEWQFPENYLTRPLAGIRFAAARYRPQMIATAGLVIPLLYVWYGLTVVKMPTDGPVFGPLSKALGFTSSYGDRYAFYDAAGWTEGYATIGHVPTQRDEDNGWRIVEIIRASGLPALSEEAGFSLLAGQDVVTNPTQLKNLYENDLFDPINLVNSIQQHRFGVVIFRAQFYPPPVLDAVYTAYYPSEVIPMNGFNYEIWRHGPSAEQRDVFTTALTTLIPGESLTLPLALTFDQASRWKDHLLLTYHDWEPLGKTQPSDRGEECLLSEYIKVDRALRVELCPAAAGSELVLTGQRR